MAEIGVIPPAPPAPPKQSGHGAARGFSTAKTTFLPVYIHFAVNSDNVVRIRQLISQGVSVDYVMHGHTPLTLAIVKENFSVALALISGGANLTIAEVTEPCRLPVHSAVRFRSLEVLKALVAHGANVQSADKMGFTPLHYAAICNSGREVIDFLLEKGAHLNARDDRGRTPFFRACQAGHMEVAQYLYTQGATVNAGDHFGWTALHEAVVCGDEQLVQALLCMGAYTCRVNLQGESVMHAAVGSLTKQRISVLANTNTDFFGRRGHVLFPTWAKAIKNNREKPSIVYALLNSGAPFTQRNLDRHSPLMMAFKSEHWEVVKLLVLAGAALHEDDEDVKQWLKENNFETECSLKLLCRERIRQALPAPVDHSVRQLPLPQSLIQVLLLSEYDAF